MSRNRIEMYVMSEGRKNQSEGVKHNGWKLLKRSVLSKREEKRREEIR